MRNSEFKEPLLEEGDLTEESDSSSTPAEDDISQDVLASRDQEPAASVPQEHNGMTIEQMF